MLAPAPPVMTLTSESELVAMTITYAPYADFL